MRESETFQCEFGRIAADCVRVASACFTIAGGSALYETSPLQRRLRDLHAATQHVAAQQRHYVSVGKLLLDQGNKRALAVVHHSPVIPGSV
jgi:hypothetical protein